MDLQKTAIIKYYEKDGKWKDITKNVRSIFDKINHYEVSYSNNEVYCDKIRNIKILSNPSEEDITNYVYFYNGNVLTDILLMLKFGEWTRVFFNNSNIESYETKNITSKKIVNNDEKAKKLLDYLRDISNYVEDDKGVLKSQLEELQIMEDSVLYKIIKNQGIETYDVNPLNLIFPFVFNKSQKEATFHALNNDISLIQGPPGTGKTQVILNIITNLICRNKTVAVVSGNNEATRNVAQKLQEKNIDFLSAFLGNKENITDFFAHENKISEEVIKWKNLQSELIKWEQEVRKLNSINDLSVQSKTNISILTQQISELKIEIGICDAEFVVKHHLVSPKIIKKNFTMRKLLELKAELELLTDEKTVKFFTKVRYLFKYGIFSVDKHFENRVETINYLTHKYYEMKIESLRKQLDNEKNFLDKNKNKNIPEMIEKVSTRILKARVSQLYFTNIRFTKNNYRYHFGEFTRRFPIVFSTTHSLRIASGQNYLYDYVVMDESSQIDLVSAIIALSCAKNVVFVGDLMQLSNVVKNADKNLLKKIFAKYNLPARFNYSENSILRCISNQYAGAIHNTLLNEHFRCDPEIMGFCNKRFYNNQLIFRREHISGNGVKVIYTESHHARKRTNERQVDIIKNEILPQITGHEIGIIAPFRDQVSLLNSRIKPDDSRKYVIDTIHKFQGKEKETIIISTVVNKVKIGDDDNVDFLNNPNLLNVAISRAKNNLYLVVSEELMKQNGALLSDFARYIKYFTEEGKVEKTHIFSILDLMYKDYSPVLEAFRKKLIKVSDFESENIIATQIKEICEEKKFGALDYVSHYPLQKIVRTEIVSDEGDRKFLLNPNTHCDFIIYNTLDKSVRLVVEVDGTQHNYGIQKLRDERKDRILMRANIPLLRIATTSSMCKERIEEKLSQVAHN